MRRIHNLILSQETIPAFKSNIRNIPTVSNENAIQVDFLEELFAAV